jgi:hypothetical protein
MGGPSEFYAPAIYTDAEKFQKLDFEKIHKAEKNWLAAATTAMRNQPIRLGCSDTAFLCFRICTARQGHT